MPFLESSAEMSAPVAQKITSLVSKPTLLDMSKNIDLQSVGVQQWNARGQNFDVNWSRAGSVAATVSVASEDEIMVLVLDGSVNMVGIYASAEAPARHVCILPAGTWRLELNPGATCVTLRSLREDVNSNALNEFAYVERDARLVPVGPAYHPLNGDGIRLLDIDKVVPPGDKARLKILQSSTLSINYVEYEGPRDRTALSPHSHAAFEQGSLGLAGSFVHHLRTPWTEDATTWQDDRHAQLGAPSLMVVLAGLIHTSEGVGPGKHILIDVFSPPRADFIAKGWVANSMDYAAQDGVAG